MVTHSFWSYTQKATKAAAKKKSDYRNQLKKQILGIVLNSHKSEGKYLILPW